jgi:hypothetical protein
MFARIIWTIFKLNTIIGANENYIYFNEIGNYSRTKELIETNNYF